MEPPRIVALTDGSLFGRRVVDVLHAVGIPADVVTISHAIPRWRGGPLGPYLRRAGRAWVASVRPVRAIRQRRLPAYPQPPIHGGRCNGRRMLEALRALRPDYILMLGGGVLSPAAIETARGGILNGHPALLPWIRGVDVLRHAVLRDVPLGVTGHFIDAGIDTGDIVCRYLLPVRDDDGFDTLAERADHLATAVLVDMARRVHDAESLPRVPSPQRFPLCRKLDPDAAGRAEERLRSGAAADAYRRSPPDPAIRDGRPLLEQYEGWWGGCRPF